MQILLGTEVRDKQGLLVARTNLQEQKELCLLSIRRLLKFWSLGMLKKREGKGWFSDHLWLHCTITVSLLLWPELSHRVLLYYLLVCKYLYVLSIILLLNHNLLMEEIFLVFLEWLLAQWTHLSLIYLLVKKQPMCFWMSPLCLLCAFGIIFSRTFSYLSQSSTFGATVSSLITIVKSSNKCARKSTTSLALIKCQIQRQWECGQEGCEIQVGELRLQQLKEGGEHEEMNSIFKER